MLKRIVVLLFFVQVSFGQTKDGVELCLEYQKIVSGFTSAKDFSRTMKATFVALTRQRS